MLEDTELDLPFLGSVTLAETVSLVLALLLVVAIALVL